MKNLFLTLSVIGCSAISMQAVTADMTASIRMGEHQPSKGQITQHTVIDLPGHIKKAPAKAAAIESVDKLAGEWEWNYYDLIKSNPNALGMVTIEAGEGNKITISGLLQIPGVKSLEATVDLTAGTINIPIPQKMGADQDGDINFYLKTYDQTTGEIHAGAANVDVLVGRISGSSISFPEEYIWVSGDAEQESLGWYFVTALNSWTNASDQEEGWTDYCTATYVDGWAVPAFGMDPEAYPWTVQIQQSEYNAFLYRIHNPYLSDTCPMPSQYLTKGNIVFDLTDPDFVGVVPKITSGFTVQGTNYMYVNAEGMYMSEGMTPEEIKDFVGDLIENWSQYKEEENTLYLYNLAVNYAGMTDQMYTWQDQQGNDMSPYMKGSLVFDRPLVAGAGVADIADDEIEATTEYFTIDGIRLDSPAQGLTIVRKGSKVSKIFVR